MRFLPVLLVSVAALGAISTPADARDGCGRGMFYNGYRCVPQGYERGPDPRFFEGRREYRYDGGYRQAPARGARCPYNYTVQDGVCKPYTGR